ncbi:MAG: (Fe-S)-binding protein [Candidatus Schekmanbacteria bacterium]|nr:MAG: (Fe-S)-binding protein [Candidatus Schekmanbacteria bacterium]
MELEKYRYDVEMCVRSSSCKWIDPMYSKSKRFNKICPINTKFKFDSFSCQGIMDIALAYLDGEIGINKDLYEILYHCTLCGACDVMCKRCIDNERLEVIEAFRCRYIEKGGKVAPVQKKILANVVSKGNLYGASPQKRVDWYRSGEASREDSPPEVLYFVGCSASYRYNSIAQSTVRILESASVSYKLFPQEQCCGNPLIRLGYKKEADEIREKNLQLLSESGCNTIVTSCAECYHMWKVDYPRLAEKSGTDYEILHISEYTEKLLEEGRLKISGSLEKKITYHDSCRLGRLSEPYVHWDGKRIEFGRTDPPKVWRRGTNGVYDAPRNVFGKISGIELREMERMKENTWCCGAGGMVKWIYNDFSLWSAKERLEEAGQTDAEILVSSCPFCKWNFSEANENENLEIMDFTELVAKVI